MKKINYLNLYLKQYKNIPNIIFWGTIIVWILGSLVAGIYYGDWEGVIIGGIIVVVGIALGVIDAFLKRFFAAILISQKVVVTDTLLSMKDDKLTPVLNVEDELPEL